MEDGHDQGSSWEAEESIMFNLEMLLQKTESGELRDSLHFRILCVRVYHIISNIGAL